MHLGHFLFLGSIYSTEVGWSASEEHAEAFPAYLICECELGRQEVALKTQEVTTATAKQPELHGTTIFSHGDANILDVGACESLPCSHRLG